jgi:amino acid transporter
MKEHKISLLTAILLTMNIMIGSGILIGPGQIAAAAGNASFLAWPLVALIFLPMVLCTAQLGRIFPGRGGFYMYAKEGLSVTAGFMSGLLYIIGYTFAVAIEVLAVRKMLLIVMGDNWFLSNVMLFNIVCILVFMGINLLSFKLFSRLLNSLTITKILPPVILVALLPFILDWNFTVSTAELMAVPKGLPLAIFGFFGFEYCSSLSHLIEDSERNAPKAALYGFLATAALYTLFHFGALNVMGSTALASEGAAAFAQYLYLPIPFLKPILMFLIPVASVLTVFAAGNGILNANVMMMKALADEKLFWKAPLIAKQNAQERPWVAIVLQGFIVFSIVTFVGNLDHVASLSNLGILSSFLLPFISLLLVQRRRGFVKAIPLTVLAIVVALGLVSYTIIGMGKTYGECAFNMLPFVGIVIAGYLLFLGRESKSHKNDQSPLLYH